MDGSQGGVDTLDGGVNVSKSAVDAMDGSQGGVGLFDRIALFLGLPRGFLLDCCIFFS